MKKGEWKDIYGETPVFFRMKVERTLDGLEEGKKMKKRCRISAGLIAAALIVLMAGAAIAAGMGLIENVNRYDDIEMLPTAGELVERNLGGLETELFTVVAEEAVYDRYTVYVQLRIEPKDKEQYALFSAEYPDPDRKKDVYVYDTPELYAFSELTGRTDGKKVLFYDVWAIQAAASQTGWLDMDYLDVENNEDGSASVWLEGQSREGLTDDMEIRLLCRWGVLGEYEAPRQGEGRRWMPEEQEFSITVRNAAEERVYRMEPVGESETGEMTFYSGSIVQTPISAHYSVSYLCRPAGLIGFTDVQGNPMEAAWGNPEPRRDQEIGRWYDVKGSMQPFGTLPGTIYVAVYGGVNRQEIIDRIEVRLIPEE